MLNGTPAEVYLTSAGKNDQKPLDLNPPSAILLITFFKIRMKITIQLLLGILNELDNPKKIVIYEKQNLHALVELSSTTAARKVKEALDGKMWKAMFLIRVQYTSKRNLSVNPNSPFEYEAPEGDPQEEALEEHEEDGVEQQHYYVGGNYMPYNPMAPPMRPMTMHQPPMYQGYQQYPMVSPKPVYMPPSPGMKQSAHAIAPPIQKPSPQQQSRPLVQLQPPPGLRPGPQSRYAPVQMQPLKREEEVDPKDVYYYSKAKHQYAPPSYPDMFNSPQMVGPFRPPPVKYTHEKADERYLLQYCSPMVRPRPLHPPQQQPISRYRIVKLGSIRENFRPESLLNICDQFGTVVSLKVIKREKKSECFIQFYQHSEANAAAEHMDGLPFGEVKLEASLTKYLTLQEIDIFEKGKTVGSTDQSLFMDFSAEIDHHSGLDSPGNLHRGRVPAPSRFVKILDVKVNHQKEIEALLGGEHVVSLVYLTSHFLAEFPDVAQAVAVIAKYHGSELSDGT
jgi:hypothetical protein